MRIAVVTHSFPPSTHSNAKRPYYIVKALIDSGWEVKVFTSLLACPSGVSELLDHPNLKIIRIEDPVDRFRRKFAGFERLHRLVTMTLSGFLWPDQYSSWAKILYRKFLRPDDYDRVLVFVFPPSAYLARHRIGKNWVFDLQESVTPQFEKVQRRSPLQRWRMPRLRRMESAALHSAGRVVFTANTNREAYIQSGLVPAEKTTHIPYFFDAGFFSNETPRVQESFVVNYFGNFDWRGSRSPKVFFQALSTFLERNPGARMETRFVFRGGWLPGHHELVEELNLQEVVDIFAAVPYETYLKLLRESPVLLLVVAPDHNLFMPSKIVDYFGAGRPILALIPRESEMRAVLDEAKMTEFAADHDDVVGCIAALESLWKKYKSGQLVGACGNVEKWSSESQLPNYVKMLECLN